MINLGSDEQKENSIDVDFQNAPSEQEAYNMHSQMGQGFDMNQPSNDGMGHNNANNQMGYQGQHQMNQGQNYNQGQGYNQRMGMQQGYPNQGHPNQGYQNQAMQNGYNQDQMGYNQQMNGQTGGYNQGMGMNQNQYEQNYNQANQFANPNMNQGYGMGNAQQGGAMVPQGEMGMDDLNSNISEYKQRLRNEREVQALTNEVNIQDTTSIINFGQRASDNISKISDELLNSMKSVKAEEASEMLTSLTKIMDKFDMKEIENAKPDSGFSKLFKSVGNTVAKMFQKYDTMGYEVQKVYVLLKKYENDIKEANSNLKKLYDGNIEQYRTLEKYIVAGEMAIEEVDMYLNQIPNDPTMNPEEKQMLVQKLEISKDMLSQRVYDLQIAENVAIQAAPMIQTIQMSNFNLMRKINSSFIVTLPIFKQCLAQAVILKRQEIQAKSIKQLDDKTNELIMRNAANTARQSVEIAKMSSGSSVQIETLQKSFETIMKGIEDTKNIQATNRQQRQENSVKLEQIKANMKKNISQ